MNTIEINGEVYVKQSEVTAAAQDLNGKPYVLVRGDRSGVFVGYLDKKEGKEVTLLQCRRLWYLDGAASISEIAVYGVSKPENCKFPKEVSAIQILDAIEILEVTENARLNISNVKIWTEN